MCSCKNGILTCSDGTQIPCYSGPGFFYIKDYEIPSGEQAEFTIYMAGQTRPSFEGFTAAYIDDYINFKYGVENDD